MPLQKLPTITPTDSLLVLLVVTLWGISFTVIKLGLGHLPPLLFSALRFALAAFPAVLLIPFPRQYWRQIVWLGLLLGVGKFSCLFFALDGHMSAGMASVLLQSQVFLTILFSAWLYQEQLLRHQIMGLGLAILGFLLLLGGGGTAFTTTGLWLILLAGLFWAVANLIMKSLQHSNLLQLMVWACVVPPVPLLLLSWWTETQQPWQLVAATQWSGWLAVLFLSLFATLLAYALWGRLLNKYPAASITPFALLIPVIGILVAQLFMDERMSPADWYSAGLIIAGLSYCTLGPQIRHFFKPRKHF